MQRIELGNTGEEISIAGLGCMYFGTRVDERTSFRLLDMYVDHGGNFLDSANKYASWLPGFKGGESETILGKWLKKNSAPSDLLISSKVGFPYGKIPRTLKKKIIISECEKSLRRLGVETIDIYFAHAYDRNTPIEETMEAFYQLIKAGKIRYAGASNYTGWRLEEANSIARSQGWEGYCCLQQRHTYMEPSARAEFNNQEFLSPEIEDLCHTKNLSIIAYSPLLGGFYSRKEAALPALYQNALNEERLVSLRNTSSETRLSTTQLVLAWMVSHSPAIIPLLGCSSLKQLEEGLVAATTSLDPDVVQRLQ
jgi:aryl-alcohol dehydrogenase-like predicted oxidoreductase